MTDQVNKKLSHQAKGLILIFAAIPIIAFLKWEYDDNVLLGAVVSVMMAFGVMELAKKDDAKKDD